MRELIEKGILPDGKEKETIDEIIREENFINYTQTIEAGAKKGDNYLGGIYRIIINGTDSVTNNPKVLTLMLKCSPRICSFRTSVPPNLLYKRESFMYSEYLPELYKIQEEYKIENGLQKVAKLYKFETEELDEFIVFEDMRVKGFVMMNRQEYLNLAHCKIVIKQLAYLHGLGFVFKEQKTELFKNLTSDLPYLFEFTQQETYIDFMKQVGLKALGTLDNNSETYKPYDEFRSKLYENMNKLNILDLEYSVMIHNDCWINNILFKHEDENDRQIPIDICLLDWQISKLDSPVKDLAYFIYNCTNSELRDEHFTELLDYYFEQLTNVLNKCNCSVDVIYPRSVFDRHLKTYFAHGVAQSLMLMPLSSSDSDEIPDHLSSEEMENNVNWVSNKSKNDEMYQIRMNGILTHAVKHGVI